MDESKFPLSEALTYGVCVRPEDGGYVVTDEHSGESILLHGDLTAVKNFICGVVWMKRVEQANSADAAAAGGMA